MSSTLSPRQVGSVEQWLDDQPRSHKEHDSILMAGPEEPKNLKIAKNESVPRAHFPNNPNNPQTMTDRDLHVHSRLQMRSRMSRRSGQSGSPADDAYVDPVECFLRVCSACLASAALAVGAVTFVFVHHNRLPAGGSVLDNRLGWVIAVPVAAVAVVWQLTRLSLLAWHTAVGVSSVLLAADLLLESLLSVGSVICAILAGFQAARHAAYNRRHHGDTVYEDVGPEIALSALLGLLSMTSFAVLALAVVEAILRRRGPSSGRSTSSSVIEIIS